MESERCGWCGFGLAAADEDEKFQIHSNPDQISIETNFLALSIQPSDPKGIENIGFDVGTTSNECKESTRNFAVSGTVVALSPHSTLFHALPPR